MPKFNFRLKGYLGLKSKLEDQRGLEYGQALTALESERVKLSALEARRLETIASFRGDISESVNTQTAGAYNDFIESLKISINKQTGRVRKAEAEAERRRLALTEAMKERKMLETLKDKDYEDFVYEQNLAEQKAADEIVSFRRGKL